MMLQRKRELFFVFCLLLCMGFVAVDTANALRITLKRVVFEGSKRAEVLTLINNSSEEKTYRIGWRHFEMTPDKSLVAVEDDQLPPGIKPVTDMIRFAPRRFTIPPNSSQQVRLMLRMPAGLEDGEYRSHLWIRPEADTEELKLRREMEKQGRQGVSLRMLAGVTMPVIVRKGALNASVEVGGLRASKTTGFIDVAFRLTRQGNRSVYGDIEYVCNGGAYVLKSTRGIAIYPEVDYRDFSLRIARQPDQPSCNSLTVKFAETSGFAGEEVRVLAEATTPVN